jgi:hypothetical protein
VLSGSPVMIDVACRMVLRALHALVHAIADTLMPLVSLTLW